MRSTLLRGLFVLTISLAGVSATAQAQDSNRCRFSPAECRELRGIAEKFARTAERFAAMYAKLGKTAAN